MNRQINIEVWKRRKKEMIEENIVNRKLRFLRNNPIK